jgi:hypothetical protein
MSQKDFSLTLQSDFHRMIGDQVQKCHSQIKSYTDSISESVYI